MSNTTQALSVLTEAREDGVYFETNQGRLVIDLSDNQKHWYKKIEPYTTEIIAILEAEYLKEYPEENTPVMPSEYAFTMADLENNSDLLAPVEQPAPPQPASTYSGNGQPFDVVGFMQRNCMEYKVGSHNGSIKYVLAECPFNPEHKAPDAAIFVGQDGKLGFKCQHNSCANYHWQDVRAKFEPRQQNYRQNRQNPIKTSKKRGCVGGKPKSENHFRPFPTDCLPMPLNTVVEKFAQAIGCDESFIALPILTMLASLISCVRRLVIKQGWYAVPVLWSVLIGYSGSAKTPALKAVLQALRKRQRKEMELFNAAMKDYETELAHYRPALTKWERTQQGEPPPKPEPPTAVRLLLDNATVESILPILEANPKQPFIAKDELAGWFASFDRYAQGKGGDESFWLSAFNGETHQNDRKTGIKNNIYLPYVCLSVLGGIQPDILKQHLNSQCRQSGLAARLLMAYPPQKAKQWTDAEIEPSVELMLETIVTRMLTLDFQRNEEGRQEPVYIGMNSEAKQLFVEYYNRHNLEQANLTGDMAAAWSKLEEYAARIALVIHYARWAANDFNLANDNQVDASSMQAAIAITEWFKNEAKRVYTMFHESETDREHRQLIEWITKRGGTTTARDIQRNLSDYAEEGAAEEMLEQLVQAGYGTWELLPTTPQGGRPSRRFVLNSTDTTDTTPENTEN